MKQFLQVYKNNLFYLDLLFRPNRSESLKDRVDDPDIWRNMSNVQELHFQPSHDKSNYIIFLYQQNRKENEKNTTT